MPATTVSRALRTSLRIAFTAFAVGVLLGMTSTMASAASETMPAAFAAEHNAPEHDSPPAPSGPGALTTCPEGADCGADEPLDPEPQHDTSDDLTACPAWKKCDPPPKDPGGLTICPAGEDCDPEPPGPGGLTTCPEHEDCSPSEPTGDSGGDNSGDDPAGDNDPGSDFPLPTRIDTGMGGTASAVWSWSRLCDVLLALTVGSAGAYAGARL